jgi:protein SCO1/2
MKRPFWKDPFFLGFLIGAAALTILPFLQRGFLSAPPPRSDLGAWSLVDQSGKPFGSEDLKGKVWIASFFFTRCPTVCPGLQAKLGAIEGHVVDLGDKIHLVSFSVDPEFDTPEVLRAYAEKRSANPARWHFLTGPRATLEELLMKKMFVDMGTAKPVAADKPDLIDISHSAKFALIDQNGQLRDMWSTDDEGIGQLINAARMLAKEGPQP